MNLEELGKKYETLAASLEKANKRIQELEDAEAIRDLQANYIYWLSSRDWEKIVDCFSDDAVCKIEATPKRTGKAEISEMFKNLTTNYPNFQEGGRILAQPVIDVNGDKARGYWTMAQFRFNFTTSSETVSLFGPGLQGKYDVKYVKEHGKWKFADLKYVRPWPENPVYGVLPPEKQKTAAKKPAKKSPPKKS
jgi:ketosteroid isomerase-like protein